MQKDQNQRDRWKKRLRHGAAGHVEGDVVPGPGQIFDLKFCLFALVAEKDKPNLLSLISILSRMLVFTVVEQHLC